MRVIAGKAGRLKLVTPAGELVRPTTDRIKETLFNIINNRLFDISFLDMFAGSGGIGIEALSRGAADAVFVENSIKSIECIRKNLETTRLGSQARILQCDAADAVRRLFDEKKHFDIIFMDPPYEKGFEKLILEGISKMPILETDGIIIIESSVKTDFDFAAALGFEVTREKVYGSNKHVFLKMCND